MLSRFLSLIKPNFSYQSLMENPKDKLSDPFKVLYRVFAYSFQHPVILTLTYLSMFTISMLNVYNPGLGEQLIYILSQKEVDDELKNTLFFRFQIEFGILIIECLQFFFRSQLASKIERKMNEEFYYSLLQKNLEYFDQKKIGELTTKLNNDLGSLKALSTENVSGLFQKGFTMLGSLGFMLSVSPKLLVIFLVLLAPRVGLLWNFRKGFRELQRAMMKLKGESNSLATESFFNIRTVKSFSTEEIEFQKFQKKLDEYHKVQNTIIYKEFFHEVAKNLLKIFLFIVISFQGAWFVQAKEMSAFELSRFIGSCRQFSMSLLMLEHNIKRILASLSNAERIFKELDRKVTINPNADKIEYIKELKGEIIFKDVFFSYPGKKDVQVLKNVNLHIKRGERVALVGESGGGKSSLVALLQRLYEPTKGEILIDGRNLNDYNLKWLHSRMGMISQDPSLFSGTIEENITYGVDSYNKDELEQVVTNAYVKKFVEDKKLFPEGLQSHVGERGGKLSGGQKQRVAIARALIKKPDILILDEATSALDADSEFQIMKGLESILTNKNLTVIIIAHRLSTIMNCDSIAVCQSGEIVEIGKHDELMELGGVYRDLVDKQFSLLQNKS